MKSTIVVVVGPNASGKSDLGVRLAKKYNGEIISADSRQVYKGLNIGSGKITTKEMRGIPHYCLDIASPKRVLTADDFKTCGLRAMKNILKKNKTPIIVGGTGFYIDILLERISTATVPPNPALRKRLEKKSVAQLFEMLKKLDPERAETIDPHNPRRLVRAIEIAAATKNNKHGLAAGFEPGVGRFPTSGGESAGLIPERVRWDERGKRETMFDVLYIGIKHAPEVLKKRIHIRLLRRLDGIIREVQSLHKKGVSWKRLYDLGLEYRYGALYLQKRLKKDEFASQLEIAIWHYARRQMTWFRGNPDIKWVSSAKEAILLIKKYKTKTG